MLRPGLESMAKSMNNSFQYSVFARNFTYSMAVGLNDHEKKIPLKTENIVPLGSITKSWTAVGIMRLYE